MATNTQLGVGIRRTFSGLGDRNFETSGTVQYAALREPLEFLGVSYSSGTLLPFDVGGTSYSAAALATLELYWNNGLISATV